MRKNRIEFGIHGCASCKHFLKDCNYSINENCLQCVSKDEKMKYEYNKQVKPSYNQISDVLNGLIKDVQYELRDSYNSSSCLNNKQESILREKLYDLLDKILR